MHQGLYLITSTAKKEGKEGRKEGGREGGRKYIFEKKFLR
jgi:hypothetical protein